MAAHRRDRWGPRRRHPSERSSDANRRVTLSHTFAVGDKVRLQSDNRYVHGAEARIKSLTNWGAYVATAATISGEYRAAFVEMIPIDRRNVEEVEVTQSEIETVADVTKSPQGVPLARLGHIRPSRQQAKQSGYSGDICDICQGSRMIRDGKCVKCAECGASNGGCS